MSETNRRPKVWVIQESRTANYSDAERYGEIQFITSDEFKPVAGSKINDQIIADIKAAAYQAEPQDFLILTGNPMIIGFAFAQFRARVDMLNLLHWDRMQSKYHHYTFQY